MNIFQSYDVGIYLQKLTFGILYSTGCFTRNLYRHFSGKLIIHRYICKSRNISHAVLDKLLFIFIHVLQHIWLVSEAPENSFSQWLISKGKVNSKIPPPSRHANTIVSFIFPTGKNKPTC